MQNPIFALMAVVIATGLAVGPSQGASHAPDAPNPATDEKPFLAENNAAMDKMMAGMTVKPTGDADVDFTAMMIPHHQGAIDMALAELRYGKNEKLRRIAQEIVVDQQQEIVAMRLAIGQPLPPSTAAPTQTRPPAANAPASSMSMPMNMKMNKDTSQ